MVAPICIVYYFNNILFDYHRYVRHMPDSFRAVNMKIELCELTNKMMGKRKDLFFLSEIKFRNKLVEYLTYWIMASSSESHSIPDDEKMLLRFNFMELTKVAVYFDNLVIY